MGLTTPKYSGPETALLLLTKLAAKLTRLRTLVQAAEAEFASCASPGASSAVTRKIGDSPPSNISDLYSHLFDVSINDRY